jgi:hypothetical protein
MADEQKHPGGRPLKFETAQELDQKIDEYLADRAPHVVKIMVKKMKLDGGHYWAEDEAMSDQQPVNIASLAFFLGTDRRTLLNYKKRDEFFPSIQRALAACEAYAADMLASPFANGMKFNLQNNHGWEDRVIRENEGGLFKDDRVKVEIVEPKQAEAHGGEDTTEPDAASSADTA